MCACPSQQTLWPRDYILEPRLFEITAVIIIIIVVDVYLNTYVRGQLLNSLSIPLSIQWEINTVSAPVSSFIVMTRCASWRGGGGCVEEACGFGKQLCCSVNRRLKTNLSKQETMAGVNKCAECEHNKIKKRNGNNRLGSLNDQMFCSVLFRSPGRANLVAT